MKHLILSIIFVLLTVNIFAGGFTDKSPFFKNKTEDNRSTVDKVSTTTIANVASTHPTDCGVADGTITITASSVTGGTIEYSIDSGQTWQPSNIFIALAGGTYCPAAREQPNGTIDYASCLNIIDKVQPIINSVVSIDPSDCSSSNGSIIIIATGASLEYSIDGGLNWQVSNSFTNLPCGTYTSCVRNTDGSCLVCDPVITTLTASSQSSATITSVLSTDPTDCGVTDGTIAILASSSTGSPIEYSIDSGQTWIPSNIFSGLAGGNYCPAVREIPNGTIEYASCLNINDKVAPVIASVTSTSHSDCSSSNGTITIFATGQGGLEYSIDGGINWQVSNTFTNLTCGTYPICIRNADGTCLVCAPNVVFNTIVDSIAIGAVHTVCVPTGNLSSTPVSTTVACNNLQNAIVDSIVGTCLYLYADDYGLDTTCVVVCDNLGTCDTTQVIVYVEDGVWPGDTDDNTKVNNNDLLTLGLGFGSSGTPRSSFSNAWNGFISQKWNVLTPVSNIDYRHIDCNGDGTINADDTLAIVQNWAKYYFKSGNGGGGTGVPIYVGAINNANSNYPSYQAPIILGDASNQANNLYGAAFTITYDTTYIVNSSVYITFDNSWVGTKNVDMLGLERNFPDDGDIEAAFTRIDGVNVNGFGSIGILNFTIKDDIFQRPGGGMNTDSIILNFEIVDVKMIENDEMDIPANPQQANVTITSNKQVDLSRYVNVFPNPATTMLYIQTNHLQVNHIDLSDVTGRVLYAESVSPQSNYKLDIQSLSKGVYNLKIQTTEGIVTKRIIILDL